MRGFGRPGSVGRGVTIARRPGLTVMSPSSRRSVSDLCAVPVATLLIAASSAIVGIVSPGLRRPDRICSRRDSAMTWYGPRGVAGTGTGLGTMLAIVSAARRSASLTPARVDLERRRPAAAVAEPAGHRADVDAGCHELRRRVVPQRVETRTAELQLESELPVPLADGPRHVRRQAVGRGREDERVEA